MPPNLWGTAPEGTCKHCREVRRDNGKLMHDGNNTVTPTLEGLIKRVGRGRQRQLHRRNRAAVTPDRVSRLRQQK